MNSIMHYVLNAVVSLKFCHCRLHVSCVLVRLLGPTVSVTQRASGPYVLLLFLSFLFSSARDLRGLLADRHESLPHDQKWVQF